ncbi:MAG: SRPBCC domain-containing protein [Pseudomonadota bacterium]
MSTIKVEPSVLEHEFDAPVKLVFEAWTQENHLCKWQVPNDKVICEYQSADIRPGGSALHKMIMPNGNEMWLLTRYHELEPFHTIVFTQYQSNEKGEIVPPPMPDWPKEIQATIKLTEANGKTSMEFIWQPINPTKEEAEAWKASQPEHGKGWGGAFILLHRYLLEN